MIKSKAYFSYYIIGKITTQNYYSKERFCVSFYLEKKKKLLLKKKVKCVKINLRSLNYLKHSQNKVGQQRIRKGKESNVKHPVCFFYNSSMFLLFCFFIIIITFIYLLLHKKRAIFQCTLRVNASLFCCVRVWLHSSLCLRKGRISFPFDTLLNSYNNVLFFFPFCISFL